MSGILEKRIGALVRREDAILVGSGTAAIYLGLMAATLPRQSVVLVPNICCVSPVLAILWAGLRPCFVDVESESLTISIKSVQAAIERHPVKALLAVHLFGRSCKIFELEDLCRTRQILLIEDCAQSLGGQIEGSPLGSFGDLSVLSFGFGKTIELGHGGALVGNNPKIMEAARQLLQELPKYDINSYKKARERRRSLYFQIEALSRVFPFSRRLTQIFRLFRSHYLFRFDEAQEERLLQLLHDLDNNLSVRRNVVAAYLSCIRSDRFRLPDVNLDEDVLTRFTIEVGNAMELAEMLRSHGLNASAMYPCLNSIFNDYCSDRRSLRISEQVSGRLLNLWTNSQGERDMTQTVSLLNA